MPTYHPHIEDACRNILRREGRPVPDAVGRVDMNVTRLYSAGKPKDVDVDLFNYGIDGNIPRPEHKTWLTKQLVPFVMTYRYHVKILGRASTLGSARDNQRVATERALLLKEFLAIECGLNEAAIPGSQMRAQSNHFASNRQHDEQRDRAVRLILSPRWLTRPDPPPPPPPPLRDERARVFEGSFKPDRLRGSYSPFKKYKIRYLEGAGISQIGGVAVHRFEIMDEDGNRKQFVMKALMAGKDVYYNPGPFYRGFMTEITSDAQSLDEFDGRWAAMGTVNVTNFNGKTGLKIKGTKPTEIDTGLGIGGDPTSFPVRGCGGRLESHKAFDPLLR